jgi:alpha-1,6-mannosyltransferase
MFRALPVLARRYDVDPTVALWCGVANPLVLLHAVSGAHNDSIAIGLMLTGIELGTRRGGRLLNLARGMAFIAAASAIKIPAIMCVAFIALHWSLKLVKPLSRLVIACALGTGITVVVYAVPMIALGVDLGWIAALGNASRVDSLMSVTTDLGLIGGIVGETAGLGSHTISILALTRAVGLFVGVLFVIAALVLVHRRKLDPVSGIALGFAGFVFFGPVVHPWYWLWAVVPISVTRSIPGCRQFVLAVSSVFSVVVPPPGADFNFRAYELEQAVAGGGVLLCAVFGGLWCSQVLDRRKQQKRNAYVQR